ncbi:MAG: PAS-domain containing protein [Rhodospirillales bacterium]|nr:PAS-domain containing protein [Rhodospirillales bacterium]
MTQASSAGTDPRPGPAVMPPPASSQPAWRRWLRSTASTIAVLLAATMLIGLAWIGTFSAIRLQRAETETRAAADAAARARLLEDDLHREFLDIDQALAIMAAAWRADPAHFDLAAWHRRLIATDRLARAMFLTDARGVVSADTDAGAVGTDLGQDAFFRRLLADPAATRVVLSRAHRDGNGGWRIEAVLALRDAKGNLAGTVGISVDAAALVQVAAELPPAADMPASGLPESGMLVQVVGLGDGSVLAVTGIPGLEPGGSIAGSAEFAAIAAHHNGEWVGVSADGVARIHAFRPVAGTALDVVVGVDQQNVMAIAARRARGALLFACGITALLLLLAAGMLRELRAARRREASLTLDRGELANANTGLALAKAEAERQSAQLQATLAGMSDGVSLVDGSLRLVAWNPNFPILAGLPPRLLRVGLPMEEMLRAQARAGMFGPVDEDAEVARRINLLRAGSHRGVMERTRPDGRVLELRRNPLPDGGFVTLFTDITARKQAEEVLHAARRDAEAASAAKSRFVAIVSHEIRSPLNAMLNALSLLAESGLHAAQLRLLDMARHSGDALFGLLNDILEMSRMEAGQLTLRPVSFALAPLLDSVVAMFSAQAERRGITLRCAVAPGVPDEIHADPGRLRQILINLISNAAKFADPGAVELAAETVFADGRTVLRLSVRDAGPPINAADRARLFEPFSQIEREGMAIQPGSGLGLAICRHLALLMGGEMGCEIGVGTTGAPGNVFWLSLKLAPQAAQGAAGEAGMARAATAGHRLRRRAPRTRILLVEDVLANQVVTATQLRREGHAVDIAATGEAALAAVAAHPYDLIFMDVFMPGLSGMEVTQRIRRMGGMQAAVPIVALTANVAPAEEEACRAAGMNAVLAKPVTLASLCDTIARVVWNSQAPAGPVQTRSAPPAGSDAWTDIARAAPADPAPPAPLAAPESALLGEARLVELRDNLPPDTLAELVEECLRDLHVRLPGLEAALERGDLAVIGTESHAMVGMAAGYGLAAMEARLRRVMQAVRHADAAAGLAAARQSAAVNGGLGALLVRSGAALRIALAGQIAAK